MAFSSSGRSFGTDSVPMAEINVTPMVDVMLVLLIIFMITAPLVTNKIPVDLPQASAQKNPDKPDIVNVALDAGGNLYWNDQPVTKDEWQVRIKSAALKDPQPVLHLRADGKTQYQRVAEIMAEAQNAGLVKMGFITNPKGAAPAAAAPAAK